MERRAFLARLAAIPLAAKAAIEAAPELETVLRSPFYDFSNSVPITDEALAAISDDAMDVAQFAYSNISAALKEAYPPGGFDEFVNAPSAFRKALK